MTVSPSIHQSFHETQDSTDIKRDLARGAVAPLMQDHVRATNMLVTPYTTMDLNGTYHKFDLNAGLGETPYIGDSNVSATLKDPRIFEEPFGNIGKLVGATGQTDTFTMSHYAAWSRTDFTHDYFNKRKFGDNATLRNINPGLPELNISKRLEMVLAVFLGNTSVFTQTAAAAEPYDGVQANVTLASDFEVAIETIYKNGPLAGVPLTAVIPWDVFKAVKNTDEFKDVYGSVATDTNNPLQNPNDYALQKMKLAQYLGVSRVIVPMCKFNTALREAAVSQNWIYNTGSTSMGKKIWIGYISPTVNDQWTAVADWRLDAPEIGFVRGARYWEGVPYEGAREMHHRFDAACGLTSPESTLGYIITSAIS